MATWNQIKNHLTAQNRVTKLIYVLAICYVLTAVIQLISLGAYKSIIDLFAIRSFTHHPFFVWKYITYAFIHANIIHVLVNVIMLFFFSQLFLTFFNEKQLIQLFVFGSVFSGVFYELIATLFSWQSAVVGASGGIMAILIATAAFRPQMLVRLPLIGNVKIFWIAVVVVLIDVLQMQSGNMGGLVTHFGGVIFGVLYGNYKKDAFGVSFSRPKKKKNKLKKVYVSSNKQAFNKSKEADEVQLKIDEILDKISKSGYDSLSKEDKEFLFRQK